MPSSAILSIFWDVNVLSTSNHCTIAYQVVPALNYKWDTVPVCVRIQQHEYFSKRWHMRARCSLHSLQGTLMLRYCEYW
jgi:hypothetical protein